MRIYNIIPVESGETQSRPKKSATCESGFALIATISVMVLLVMVALAMMSLSVIEARASGQGNAMQEARANARLALMIAIGDLQKSMGPDQRISASSGIMDSSPSTPSIDEVNQAHLTGVWQSWKWQPGQDKPDYQGLKQDGFVRWLVSHPNSSAVEDRNFVRQLPVNPVQLVGAGTSADGVDHVEASRLTLNGSGGSGSGSIAWAVFDEGQKARFALPNDAVKSKASEFNHLTAPALLGYEAISDWNTLANRDTKEQQQIVSNNTLGLLGIDPKANSAFHTISPYSSNLLTDVWQGGFSKDLSLMFDRSSLPQNFERKYLYSGMDQPIAEAPTRFTGANPIPSPDPRWKLLHSHYKSYERITEIGGGEYAASVSSQARPGPGESTDHSFFTTQQLLPVVAKAQFVFSLSAGWHGALNSMKGGAATDQDKYISWLVTDPVITLWNPYNVSLRFSESEIQLYRVPLTFKLYKNGQSISTGWTHFANTFLNADFNNRQNRYYRLNLKPKYGESDIVIRPGEYKVFTAHNHVKHYRQEYSIVGVDLRPGFNPPNGNDSVEHVGGISTLNVMVNPIGRPDGRLNGHAVRTLPLKAGDMVEVEVSAAKAGIDEFPETDKKEITSFMKFFQGSGKERKLIGGVELDYNDEQMEKNLPAYTRDELSNFNVTAEIPEGVKADDYQGAKPPPATRFKRPFLIASLHLKTEQDSRYPSRAWLQNSPTNPYASSGMDQTEPMQAQQYEFTWERMLDWKDIPGVQLDVKDRGYGGAGLYSDTGVHVTPFAGVPLVPPISMGQLRHAPLNAGGQLPLTTQIIANSFACPLVPRSKTFHRGASGTYLDHSFLANTNIFDGYFFSSATTQNTSFHTPKRSLEGVLDEFFTQEVRLPNSRYTPVYSSGVDPASLSKELVKNEGYKEIGSHLFLQGAFNVNSTSVDAWKVFLASGTKETIPVLDALTSSLRDTSGSGTVVSRFTPPLGEDVHAATDPVAQDTLRWTGHRRVSLDYGDIEALALSAVEQVKKRGPFQSVAEFVNRRLEDSALGLSGALQTAIDESGINDDFNVRGVSITTAAADFEDVDAALGNTSDGAPTSINQADLLTSLAPYISVRSDTFRIRSYGDAKDRSGQTVRVWCEAIVQRFPDYIDATTEADIPVSDLAEDSVNARFGRRIRIISFRWLSSDEV